MQKLGVLALALGAAPAALGAERKQRVLIPDRSRFADVSMMSHGPKPPPPGNKPPGNKPPGGSPPAGSPPAAGGGETAAWWLPPASAYIAAGVPAASLGVYGNAASMPTVAGTYTPYPYYTPAAGFPGDAAGYPYYGYYPSAPFAAVAGAPSGYTNVYSMLSGAYRFRAGGGEEGGAAAGAGGGTPPRFAQADLKEGAGVDAEAMKAYHAHAAGVLSSDAHAAALASGYAHPAWTDFAHAGAAAEQQQHGEAHAASAYSAAQRAHVMRMMAEAEAGAKQEGKQEEATEAAEGGEQEAEEVVVPAAAAKAAPAAAAARSGEQEEEAVSGASLSRSAIDEEIKSLEALAASI